VQAKLAKLPQSQLAFMPPDVLKTIQVCMQAAIDTGMGFLYHDPVAFSFTLSDQIADNFSRRM
jgi:hypothetical protein